jgi:hypothetical protein
MLGSAQHLAEKDAPEAARLISDLIRFLRVRRTLMAPALHGRSGIPAPDWSARRE